MGNEKVTIEQLAELLDSGIAAIDVIDKIMEDGKVTVLDVVQVPALVKALRPGLKDVDKIHLIDLENASSEELQMLSGKAILLVKKLIDKFD